MAEETLSEWGCCSQRQVLFANDRSDCVGWRDKQTNTQKQKHNSTQIQTHTNTDTEPHTDTDIHRDTTVLLYSLRQSSTVRYKYAETDRHIQVDIRTDLAHRHRPTAATIHQE